MKNVGTLLAAVMFFFISFCYFFFSNNQIGGFDSKQPANKVAHEVMIDCDLYGSQSPPSPNNHSGPPAKSRLPSKSSQDHFVAKNLEESSRSVVQTDQSVERKRLMQELKAKLLKQIENPFGPEFDAQEYRKYVGKTPKPKVDKFAVTRRIFFEIGTGFHTTMDSKPNLNIAVFEFDGLPSSLASFIETGGRKNFEVYRTSMKAEPSQRFSIEVPVNFRKRYALFASSTDGTLRSDLKKFQPVQSLKSLDLGQLNFETSQPTSGTVIDGQGNPISNAMIIAISGIAFLDQVERIVFLHAQRKGIELPFSFSKHVRVQRNNTPGEPKLQNLTTHFEGIPNYLPVLPVASFGMSDSTGTFKVPEVHKLTSKRLLVILAQGFQVYIGDHVDNHVFTLNRATTIRLRVLDAFGNPPERASICISPVPINHAVIATTLGTQRLGFTTPSRIVKRHQPGSIFNSVNVSALDYKGHELALSNFGIDKPYIYVLTTNHGVAAVRLASTFDNPNPTVQLSETGGFRYETHKIDSSFKPFQLVQHSKYPQFWFWLNLGATEFTGLPVGKLKFLNSVNGPIQLECEIESRKTTVIPMQR